MPVAGSGRYLADPIKTRLVEQVHAQVGTVSSMDGLDLGSPGGFLGLELARRLSTWTVHVNAALRDQGPANAEEVALDLPALPFEDGSLGLVTGAFLEEAFGDWRPELAQEAFRVLDGNGAMVLLYRGPSPSNKHVDRSLPEHAIHALREAGFEKVEEVRVAELDDGTWIYRVAGTVPR